MLLAFQRGSAAAPIGVRKLAFLSGLVTDKLMGVRAGRQGGGGISNTQHRAAAWIQRHAEKLAIWAIRSASGSHTIMALTLAPPAQRGGIRW